MSEAEGTPYGVTSDIPPARADRRCRSHRRPRQEHYHARADLYSLVEVHNVLVCESDAARGYESPDGRGLVRAVDAVERVTQIKCARPRAATLPRRQQA